MPRLLNWIQAARPKTLGAAISPVFVGFILAARLSGQQIEWRLLAFTLASTMALQIATNWFNDALDFRQGKDTAARVGPRRITAAGLVSPESVMLAGYLMLGLATALSVPLIAARGLPIVIIGIPSLYFCYGYTGGPFPLAYRGLGELFVILFFGFVAVMGSAFVQCGEWLVGAVVAGLQIGCLSTILIAVNNLRDLEEDRSTGKRTLAARFGVTFARVEITALLAVTYGIGLYWLDKDDTLLCSLPLAVLPLGLFVLIRIWCTPPGPSYNRLLALSGIHLLLFAGLFCTAAMP
jgi:1,4-dihydroxy-2-naphthoate polyprenyltransferase